MLIVDFLQALLPPILLVVWALAYLVVGVVGLAGLAIVGAAAYMIYDAAREFRRADREFRRVQR